MCLSRNLVVHPIDTKELVIDNTWANVDIFAGLSMGQGTLQRMMSHLFIGKLALFWKRASMIRLNGLSLYMLQETNLFHVISTKERGIPA